MNLYYKYNFFRTVYNTKLELSKSKSFSSHALSVKIWPTLYVNFTFSFVNRKNIVVFVLYLCHFIPMGL